MSAATPQSDLAAKGHGGASRTAATAVAPAAPAFIGKHTQSSSEEEESECESPLRLKRQRKRRRTVCVAAPSLAKPLTRPLSPHLLDSDSEQEFLSNAYLRRQQQMRRRSIASDADRTARRRCFDYLLGGIDAVWAEYCDSTLHTEEHQYTPRSPVSDNEELASEQAHSVQLMLLKKQLLGSKYYMSDLVDSHDADASSRFWKCWDAIRYSVVEAVEGEDCEGEQILEDLEDGRVFGF